MTNAGTILIVDDQEIARQTLEMLLDEEGYQLHFAENGREALVQAVMLVPDLILLDVMMPGMNGIEVCQKLRAHKVLAEVPILMLTALTDRESRLKAIAAGADDFVVKPFDRLELKVRVQGIMRLNRYRRLLVERVRFRWVVDNAEEGYLVIGEDDLIRYANPRACFYFDLPAEKPEETHVPFLSLARQHYRCEPTGAWDEWPQPHEGVRYLVRPETSNARSFWLQVDVLQLPSGPDMAGMLRVRDVTNQMNTLRDMRSFNASVTHKLLTPLVHIAGNLDLLAKYYRTEMENPDIAELFETAHAGSQRLRKEIDQIVQYTRNLPLLARDGDHFDMASMASLVTTTAAELGLLPVAVTYEACPVSARIALPRRAMTLIISELLENARKFHPRHTPQVNVMVTCDDNASVKLRVADDGLTLSPEQLAQVWTPYYQAEKHFTGEIAGLGLGLTMVATLVWGVGGGCAIVNRTPPPGVVVELTLPRV